jgi:hypothetical protein
MPRIASDHPQAGRSRLTPSGYITIREAIRPRGGSFGTGNPKLQLLDNAEKIHSGEVAVSNKYASLFDKLKARGNIETMTANLKNAKDLRDVTDIAKFLRMESVSPQRSKEEKIAALRALGGYLHDAPTVSFLKQESFAEKRSLEEKIAIFQALAGYS